MVQRRTKKGWVIRVHTDRNPRTIEVWEGMVNGFLGGVGRLTASNEALQLIGEFLNDRFAGAAIQK